MARCGECVVVWRDALFASVGSRVASAHACKHFRLGAAPENVWPTHPLACRSPACSAQRLRLPAALLRPGPVRLAQSLCGADCAGDGARAGALRLSVCEGNPSVVADQCGVALQLGVQPPGAPRLPCLCWAVQPRMLAHNPSHRRWSSSGRCGHRQQACTSRAPWTLTMRVRCAVLCATLLCAVLCAALWPCRHALHASCR